MKNVQLTLQDKVAFAKTAKALASDIRVNILELLNKENLNINELADKLNIPFSTAALNVKVLEDAGIIITERQPGSRGSVMKICSRKYDNISFDLLTTSIFSESINSFYMNMPIGNYCDCNISPTCGIVSEKGAIDIDDNPKSFYNPSRIEAQLIWFHKGYIEYRFSNSILSNATPHLLNLSFELCSEAPFYRLDWPSDITIWINDIEIGTWTSPGDFGGLRGKLTPHWWLDTSSQYGLLKTWEVNKLGTHIDGIKLSDVTIKNLNLDVKDYISLKIGIKDDAKNIGGINIFGEKFGNHPQNILMRIDYSLNQSER